MQVLRYSFFILTIAILSALQASGQKNLIDGIQVTFQPAGLPLKLIIGTDGPKIAFEPSLVTPLGRVSIEFTKNLVARRQAEMNPIGIKETVNFGKGQVETKPIVIKETIILQKDLLLILRNTRMGHDSYFKVTNGYSLNVVSNGHTEITYLQNVLIINMNEATDFEMSLYENNYIKESIGFSEKKEIQIKTLPEKAKLHLDNVYIGYTPCNILLNSGTHILLIEKDNFRELIDTINITDKSQYSYTLSPTIPRTTFLSEPDRADIFVNGDFCCTTPSSEYLHEGNYSIKANKKAYRAVSKGISVYKDDTVFFNLNSFEIASVGIAGSLTGTAGVELSYGNGVIVTVGFGSAISGKVPENVQHSFDGALPYRYLGIRRTNTTFLYNYNKFYLTMGLNLINHRLYLNIGGSINTTRSPYIYVAEKDLSIDNEHVLMGDNICFPGFAGDAWNEGYKVGYSQGLIAGLLFDTGILIVSVSYNYDHKLGYYPSAGIGINLLKFSGSNVESSPKNYQDSRFRSTY